MIELRPVRKCDIAFVERQERAKVSVDISIDCRYNRTGSNWGTAYCLDTEGHWWQSTCYNRSDIVCFVRKLYSLSPSERYAIRNSEMNGKTSRLPVSVINKYYTHTIK